MDFICEICDQNFVENNEENIRFFQTGCSHICPPCYRIQVENLFERSAKALEEMRHCKADLH